MSKPLIPKKSVNRLLVEKMGARSVDEFRGNAGEVFYDPAEPELYLSNGPGENPVPMITAAIGNFVIETSGRIMPTNLNKLDRLP